ncbi:MAG: hypothetical protein KDB68_16910, partial [Planctomycetes bacterium]|nr:hypothetical protein [Planctomycetota bacterium]
MHAEAAYLFRHALLRDAAYQMQMPGDRARLHELAFYLIEESFGGRAHESLPLDARGTHEFNPHPTDVVAAELAEHARISTSEETEPAKLDAAYRLYLRRAAEYSETQFREDVAVRHWQALASATTDAQRGEALRRAAVAAGDANLLDLAETLAKQATAHQRECGDRWLEGLAAGSLAALYAQSDKIELAETMYEQALAI